MIPKVYSQNGKKIVPVNQTNFVTKNFLMTTGNNAVKIIIAQNLILK